MKIVLISIQSYLVAQCGTVVGSLAGFADDYGRSYSSIFDAMKRCKEGISEVYHKCIRDNHISFKSNKNRQLFHH